MLHSTVSVFGCVDLQPVFLSKQERAELALKRRQEQVEEQRKKVEEGRTARTKSVPGERGRVCACVSAVSSTQVSGGGTQEYLSRP